VKFGAETCVRMAFALRVFGFSTVKLQFCSIDKNKNGALRVLAVGLRVRASVVNLKSRGSSFTVEVNLIKNCTQVIRSMKIYSQHFIFLVTY